MKRNFSNFKTQTKNSQNGESSNQDLKIEAQQKEKNTPGRSNKTISQNKVKREFKIKRVKQSDSRRESRIHLSKSKNQESNQKSERDSCQKPQNHSERKNSKRMLFVSTRTVEPVSEVSRKNWVKIGNSQLPIFNKRGEILESINSNQVSVISGDTGCGKSTQLPLFLYQDAIEKGNHFKIICTQPRRLACVNIALRVNEEVQDFFRLLNGNQSQIYEQDIGQPVSGYHIGMDAKYDKKHTKMVFATNGIFLNYIVHNPDILSSYSHVVLDEVHERDLDMDFILILLRCLLPEFPHLKVILMSATLNSSSLAKYFSPDHLTRNYLSDSQRAFELDMLKKSKRRFNSKNFRDRLLKPAMENLAQVNQFWDNKERREIEEEEQEPFNKAFQDQFGSQDSDIKIKKESQGSSAWEPNLGGSTQVKREAFEASSQLEPKLTQDSVHNFGKRLAKQIRIRVEPKFQVKIFYLDNLRRFYGFRPRNGSIVNYSGLKRRRGVLVDEYVEVVMELINFILNNIDRIRFVKKNSKMLVFLPGLGEILYFKNQLENLMENCPSLSNFKYHIEILHSDLSKNINLRNMKQDCWVFILATNIAESSITIPDIAFVLDFCLTKELFVRKNGISSLELVWSSRASCLQRKGRTGRVNNGYCFYILPKPFFDNTLTMHSMPEILRLPVDKILLKCNLIKEFLKSYLLQIKEKSTNSRSSSHVLNSQTSNLKQTSEVRKKSKKNVGSVQNKTSVSSSGEEQIKKIERLMTIFKNPKFVLLLALDSLDQDKVDRSISFLEEISAVRFDAKECEFHNTFLGKLFCELPLPIKLIKLLIFGRIFDCFEDSVNLAVLLNHEKGIFMKNKNLRQDQIANLFDLYSYMDEQQYSDLIIMNNIFKEFESIFSHELTPLLRGSRQKMNVLRKLKWHRRFKDFFVKNSLSSRALVDIFQSKHDIFKKLMKIQSKDPSIMFLSADKLHKIRQNLHSRVKNFGMNRRSIEPRIYPDRFDCALEKRYDRLKLAITASFLPRVVSGRINQKPQNAREREFLEKVLKMNSNNTIIIRNSLIEAVESKALTVVPPQHLSTIKNAIRAEYLARLVCFIEEMVGVVHRFEMQMFEIYIEFRGVDARAAIERILFLQNYYTKERKSVRLFSINGELCDRVVNEGRKMRPGWDSRKMAEKLEEIIKRAGKTSDSKEKSTGGGMMFLKKTLFLGLKENSRFIRSRLKDQINTAIREGTTFHYLNELTFCDGVDHIETLVDFVSVNKNLKADSGSKEVMFVTSEVTENSNLKYFARGLTRLPSYPSILEIFLLIFEKRSVLYISDDWKDECGVVEETQIVTKRYEKSFKREDQKKHRLKRPTPLFSPEDLSEIHDYLQNGFDHQDYGELYESDLKRDFFDFDDLEMRRMDKKIDFILKQERKHGRSYQKKGQPLDYQSIILFSSSNLE